MGFKEILVTLDGSEASESALNYAEIVAASAAHIHLLTVAPRAEMPPLQTPSELHDAELMRDVNWPPLRSEEEAQTLIERENYLRERGGRLTDKGFIVTSEVQFGGVIETIVDVSSGGFDVIVMATHGRTGLARLAMGSVAEGVLHKAGCPVLLIPARALHPDKQIAQPHESGSPVHS